MRPLDLFGKGNLLFSISALEIGTPFLRMLILTHFLSLPELGFTSALAASYSMFEQVTDFAIYRFVFSAPREEFDAALSGAQGLSLVRGIVVGAIAFATAPVIAWLLSLSAHWYDFAVLGAIIAIRSLENLEPRVAERDYRYGAQFTVALVSSVAALLALIVVAHWRARPYCAHRRAFRANDQHGCGQPPRGAGAIPSKASHARVPGRL